MANNITNVLTFEDTDQTTVNEILAYIKTEDSAISLDKIAPEPECFRNSYKRYDSIDEWIKDEPSRKNMAEFKSVIETEGLIDASREELEQWVAQHHNCCKLEDLIVAQAQLVCQRDYGYDQVRLWRAQNWGTSREAYEAMAATDELGSYVFFYTAWTCAKEVILALSKAFPKAKLCLEYADEDYGYNCGYCICQGGQFIVDKQYNGGPLGFAFADYMHGELKVHITGWDEEKIPSDYDIKYHSVNEDDE